VHPMAVNRDRGTGFASEDPPETARSS
jgi:hypothetical protein